MMNKFSWVKLVVAGLLLGGLGGAFAAEEKKPEKIVAADPEKVTDPDFKVQGEYVGEVPHDDGPKKLGVQVIAQGNGKFQAVAYLGGLPGEGWDGSERKKHSGVTKDGVTLFQSDEVDGVLKDGVINVRDKNGKDLFKLNKVNRQSKTMGAKPPEGAIVLFDGKLTGAFKGERISEDGLLMQGITSNQLFGACKVHMEFRTPYQPNDAGQGRGNSGCYLQGRYECQILDSFGLEGKNNECGGIYTIKDPEVNMCLPPLSWQTYDITFTPAVFDADGKKVKNARMTVEHNGVVVQRDTELTHATTASPLKEGPENGPLYIQDHGNPVRFRNIWVLPQK